LTILDCRLSVADESQKSRFMLSRRMRLSRGRDFLATRNGGVRRHVGPLQIFVRPNDLGFARLGLSISRRAGNAVMRNTLKRRLREAFRLMQHEWTEFAMVQAQAAAASAGERGLARPQAARMQGYDVVIGAKAHDLLTLAEYRAALSKAVREAHQSWQKKQQRRSRQPTRKPGSDEG
jgi:ribonuclease P protein component